jgi:hypothetical protein
MRFGYRSLSHWTLPGPQRTDTPPHALLRLMAHRLGQVPAATFRHARKRAPIYLNRVWHRIPASHLCQCENDSDQLLFSARDADRIPADQPARLRLLFPHGADRRGPPEVSRRFCAVTSRMAVISGIRGRAMSWWNCRARVELFRASLTFRSQQEPQDQSQ